MPHDYLMGLVGGVLMGAACVGLVLFNGRILGVSGVLGGALSFRGDAGWRWAFIAGMLIAGAALSLLYPQHFAVDIRRTFGATLVGGLLVGAGTQLGSGCTSGHGICGVGRLSARSVVATCTFMVFGAIAVLLIRRVFHGAL